MHNRNRPGRGSYVSFYTLDGRKVRRSSRTTVKAEAAAFLREELKKRDAGQASQPFAKPPTPSFVPAF
jgi:hypothetical protein